MGETIVWSRRVADELWSGVVTPLTFSVLAEPMARHMAQRRLEQAGLLEASRQPVFRLLRGHVYVNATLLRDVMREVPSLLLSEGVLALLPPALRTDLGREPRAAYDPRTIATVLRLTWNERSWTPWSRAELFRAEAEKVAAELGGFEVSASASVEDIALLLSAVRDRLGSFLEVVSWAMIYAYLFFHLAAHLSRRWLPREEALAAIAARVPGVRTFEAHEELSDLARRVREDAALAERIRSRSSEEIVAAADRGELGAFGAELVALRRRHGHRLVARDLSFPTWRERPAVLVDMVRRLAVVGSEEARRSPEVALAEAKAKVASGLGGWLRWQVFEAGLSWSREYYAVRENMRYHADYFLAALRALALAGSRRLVAARVLADTDDVFYLTFDELQEGLRNAPRPDLAEIAAQRRREYAVHRESVPPEVVQGDEDVRAVACVPETSAGPLGATPASPGVAEGAVCVVRSVDDLDRVRPGDVIVATATDPTWTSYLSLAAGLVLEVGGLLSHGAIVARELGLPAVVDLAGATTAFTSGERVRIDGTRGLVERLLPEAPIA